jgi:hypothetical protein
LSDRGGEFEFCFPEESRHIKTAAYHPQTNGCLERAHAEISKLCRIHQKQPDQLLELLGNSFLQREKTVAVHLEMTAILRYIPKSWRTKGERVWRPYVALGAGNSVKIISKSGRSTVLNPSDYRIVARPNLSDWEVSKDIMEELVSEFAPTNIFPLRDFGTFKEKLRKLKDLGKVDKVLLSCLNGENTLNGGELNRK